MDTTKAYENVLKGDLGFMAKIVCSLGFEDTIMVSDVKSTGGMIQINYWFPISETDCEERVYGYFPACCTYIAPVQ